MIVYFTDWLQLRIIAYDTVYPLNQASQYVVVNVLRNQYGPVFNQTAYTAQLPINSQLGSPIVQLSASDLDINVSCASEFLRLYLLTLPVF